MTTKNSHGFTLWAVPRFQRTDIAPLPAAESKPDWTESFAATMRAREARLDEKAPDRLVEICH